MTNKDKLQKLVEDLSESERRKPSSTSSSSWLTRTHFRKRSWLK